MRYIFYFLLVCTVTCACKPAQKAGASALTSQVSSSDRDGSSYEKAVMVKSIREEYEWVKAHYPGSQMEKQALLFKDKKPYDALTFKLADGSTKIFYFDISSFFGKF